LSGEINQDDQLLIRYLLGALPDEEAERLDELSISDTEFSWRLKAVENDLVDAYVKNELSGETLERFRTFYLVSPLRREKVKFASAQLALHRRRKVRFSFPLPIPRWALAAAAAAGVIAAILIYDDLRLRAGMVESQRTRAGLEQRQIEMMKELEASRRAANQGRDPVDPLVTRVELALLLPPPSRGGGPMRELVVPARRDVIAIELQLEADDFGVYAAALQMASDNRVLWRSPATRVSLREGRKVVSLRVPAGLFLQPERYLLTLSSSGPNSETVGSYPFRVQIK